MINTKNALLIKAIENDRAYKLRLTIRKLSRGFLAYLALLVAMLIYLVITSLLFN